MSEKIDELRRLVFEEIKRCLADDCHCKSYEGQVTVVYPNYFDEPDDFAIRLDCYLIGPARHYVWSGTSIDDCADKAIADVKKWIEEWKCEADQ